jgi:predicted ribosomally synthesized peptide with SipW-like signal peptide
LKKIVISVFSIAVVSILAVGATRAYFSDQANANGNTFAAGTLDLTLNNKNGLSHAYTITNLMPGDWNLTGQVILKNTGTVNGHAWLEITNVHTSGNGALGNLVEASFQENVAPWTRYGGTTPIAVSANTPVDLFDLNAGASVPLVVYAVWPNGTPATDNPGQGETTTFDVVFHLDQKICGVSPNECTNESIY